MQLSVKQLQDLDNTLYMIQWNMEQCMLAISSNMEAGIPLGD